MSYLFEIIRDDEVILASTYDTLEDASLAEEFKPYFEEDPSAEEPEAIFDIDDLVNEMVMYPNDRYVFNGLYGYVLKVTEQFEGGIDDLPY
ncbi:hypothetical protein SPLA10_PHROGS00004 [Salmonella phage SPLA10]|nr:hypothetical protein SPLA10_PHROGS00004 [Salmonella phage SPLA10]